jgi:hypothetical protein
MLTRRAAQKRAEQAQGASGLLSGLADVDADVDSIMCLDGHQPLQQEDATQPLPFRFRVAVVAVEKKATEQRSCRARRSCGSRSCRDPPVAAARNKLGVCVGAGSRELQHLLCARQVLRQSARCGFAAIVPTLRHASAASDMRRRCSQLRGEVRSRALASFGSYELGPVTRGCQLCRTAS